MSLKSAVASIATLRDFIDVRTVSVRKVSDRRCRCRLRIGFFIPILFVLMTLSLTVLTQELDKTVSPPATPTIDGGMLILGPISHVWLAPQERVYLSLATDKPGYRSVEVFTEINGHVQDKEPAFNTASITPMQLSPIADGFGTQRMRIVYETEGAKYIQAQDCWIKDRDPGVRVKIKASMSDERLHITVADRDSLGAVYLFVDNSFAGRMADQVSETRLDTRSLNVGPHKIYAIAESALGHILVPMDSLAFSVEPRYTITKETEGAIEVLDQDPTHTFPVKVVRSDFAAAPKARVYVGGDLVGESDKPSFEMQMPLRNVPTGKSTVEVIGVSADGIAYPAESMAINVRNMEWEQRVGSTEEFQRIVSLRHQISQAEIDAQYWFTRAINEPAYTSSTEVSHVRQVRDFAGEEITLATISTIRTAGHSAEYIAQSQAAVVRMAQMRLQTGRLYNTIKMREAARNCFLQVIREVGPDIATGIAATGELDQLDRGDKQAYPR